MTSARMQYGSQLYLLPIRDHNIVLWDFAPLFLFPTFVPRGISQDFPYVVVESSRESFLLAMVLSVWSAGEV